MGYKTETHRLPEGSAWGEERVKGAKYMVTKDELTLGGGGTMLCTDYVSQKCTPKIYMILLTNVPPVNVIK